MIFEGDLFTDFFGNPCFGSFGLLIIFVVIGSIVIGVLKSKGVRGAESAGGVIMFIGMLVWMFSLFSSILPGDLFTELFGDAASETFGDACFSQFIMLIVMIVIVSIASAAANKSRNKALPGVLGFLMFLGFMSWILNMVGFLPAWASMCFPIVFVLMVIVAVIAAIAAAAKGGLRWSGGSSYSFRGSHVWHALQRSSSSSSSSFDLKWKMKKVKWKLQDVGRGLSVVGSKIADRTKRLKPKHPVPPPAPPEPTGIELLQSGKFEEALASFDRVLEKDPKNVEALNNKAVLLLKGGNFQDALACFDRALEVDPDNAALLNNKGILLLQNGNFEEARKCLDRVIELNPKDDGAWTDKGLAVLEYKGLKVNWGALFDKTKAGAAGALAAQGAAGSAHPSSASLSIAASWSEEGIKLLKREKFDDAVLCFDRALDLNPNNDEAWSSKGMVMFKEGRLDEALSCIDRAISIDPQNEYHRYNRGMTLRGLGRFDDEQIAAYDAALAINPSYTDALFGKGWVYYKQENYKKALEFMVLVLNIDADNLIARKIKEDCLKKIEGAK